MAGRYVCFFAAALCLSFISVRLGAEETRLAEYLPPEHFAAKQRPADYLPYARTFLEEHRLDPRAAHITHDMLMVATMLQNGEEIKAAKLRLLLEYPHSLPSGYVAKISKAGDVSGLLKEYFTDDRQTLDREKLGRFLRAVEFGHRMYGPSFFDDDLWTQSALSAQDVKFSANCQRQIKKPDSNAAKTMAIVLDARLSLRDKFIELQTLRSYNTARAFQRFLFTELTDAERADIDVRAAVVENLLHEQKLAAAVPLLAELCEESRDPQHHFWRGWALAASGDRAGAEEVLGQLQRDFASSGWAKPAAELADTLTNFDDSRTRHIEILNEAGAALQAAPPEVLEATLLWYDEQNRITSAYFSVDVVKDAFELVSATGDEQRLAYRVGPNDCDIFLAGDKTIHRYASRGLCPICNFGLPVHGGKFNFQFNFNTLQQGAGAIQQSVRSLLSLPMFASDNSRQEVMETAIASGHFPQPARLAGGTTVLRWIRPRIDEPSFTSLEIRLTSDRRLVSVLNEKGSGIADLRYGAARAMKLKPPHWPELPVETVAELGAQEFFLLFGAVMSLMTGDKTESATNVAGDVPKGMR